MTLAITNGTMIDGRGSDPQDGMTLLIEGERISALGRGVPIPRDASVIDAQGSHILPGLIDCHVHFAMEYPNVLRQLVTTPSLRLLEAIPRMRATLEAGVTTVRDAAGAPAGLKIAVERGIVIGPRMQVAVSMISQTGGHGDGFYPCCVDLGLFGIRFYDVPGGVADGVEEHEFFDLRREGEENRGHDVAEVLGEGLDVGRRFGRRPWRREIVFGRLDEVVYLGVNKLEDALLCRLFMVAEGRRCRKREGGGGVVRGGAGSDEKILEFYARSFEVRDVDEDLDDLPKVLRGELGDERGADLRREEVVEGRFETFVDDFGVSKVGGDKEVELIEEVADVDATEWVHLGEGEDAGEDHVGDGAVWGVPADVDDLLVFFGILDGHGHVVVC